MLEGGYNLRGGLVSAFARSVASHVRALAETHTQSWDPFDAEVRVNVQHLCKNWSSAACIDSWLCAHAVLCCDALRDVLQLERTNEVRKKEAARVILDVPVPPVPGEVGPSLVAPDLGAEALLVDVPPATGAATEAALIPTTSSAAAALLAEPIVAAEAQAAPTSGADVTASEEPSSKRRRRGAPVDYAALNAQLEAASKSKAEDKL